MKQNTLYILILVVFLTLVSLAGYLYFQKKIAIEKSKIPPDVPKTLAEHLKKAKEKEWDYLKTEISASVIDVNKKKLNTFTLFFLAASGSDSWKNKVDKN
jgi:hypothetical protein